MVNKSVDLNKIIERGAEKYIEEKYGKGSAEKQKELYENIIKGGGGGGSSPSAPTGISGIDLESARLEQAKKDLEAKRLLEQQQQQEKLKREQQLREATIRLGKEAQTSRLRSKFEVEHNIQVPSTQAVTRNVGESQQAFDYRAAQVGRSIAQQQPEAFRQYAEPGIRVRPEEIQTRNYPGVSLGPKPKYFVNAAGETIIVGYTQGLNINDVTNRATLSNLQPTVNPNIQRITQLGQETKPAYTIEVTKDVTRHGTISGIQPEYIDQSPRVFDISKGPSTVEKLRYKATQEPGAIGFGAGFLAGGLYSLQGSIGFGKGLLTQPMETIGGAVEGVMSLPKNIGKVGPLLYSEPAFATGFLATEYLQFKGIGVGQKGVLKSSDIYRTAGLKEIKTPIAPEYLRGQMYPLIRKGQTAGELLAEFKPKLPGEIKPGGYTASGKPLVSGETGKIITLRGTSELPGLYQAPDVSPTFLKIKGYNGKIFTINILGESLKPTVFRVTPLSYGLVPGLKSSTKNIIGLGKVKSFFETAEKGKAYVPFIKAEKEAVIPFGTVLSKPTSRFYFKFEGRRVPIYEYTTTGKGITTAKDIFDISISSSSRVGKQGFLSPLNLLQGKVKPSYSYINKPSSIKYLPSYPSKVSSVSKLSSSLIYSSPYKSSSIISKSSNLSRASNSILKSNSYNQMLKSSNRISRNNKLYSGKSYRGFRYTKGYLGIPRTPPTPRIYLYPALSRKPKSSYTVEIRRRGKFSPYATGLTLSKAFELGTGKVRGSLAASFKIVGTNNFGQVKTPKGFYSKASKKEGLIFIQKTSPKTGGLIGGRLGSRGEKLEIQSYNRKSKRGLIY